MSVSDAPPLLIFDLVYGGVFLVVFVLVLAVILAVIDQIIKYLVLEFLAPVGSVSVIDNIFSLVYVENRGAAFGMLQNQVWFFAVITIILIGIFVYLLVSKKFSGKLFTISTALIIGGGIGNLIDRIFRGFVVDYLSLSFFPPVCNFADYCVTIGAVMFVLYLFMTMDIKDNKVKSKKTDGEENE